MSSIITKATTGTAIVGYGLGAYLIYDSYKILSEHKQDLKVFEPMSSKLIYNEGSYIYTRNPMYLGGLLTLGCGWILLFHLFPLKSISAMVIHFTVGSMLVNSIYFLNYHIVPYEEFKCQQKYGLQYIKYKQNVSRWIPNIMQQS